MAAEVVTPESVEQSIRTLAEGIARMVSTCDEQYRTFLRADHEYDIAVARAEAAYDGPSWRCKGHVTLETIPQRKARDVADAAYRYADRRAKALESELRAWQSVGASVRAMYGVAGRGEGP